jgi:hypothetical protein
MMTQLNKGELHNYASTQKNGCTQTQTCKGCCAANLESMTFLSARVDAPALGCTAIKGSELGPNLDAIDYY